MKKAALFFLALVVLVVFTMKDSEAGQLCWTLKPYDDIIWVSTSNPDPNYPQHKLLTGRWSSSSGGYACPVVGSMEQHVNGADKVVGLHASTTVDGTLYNTVLEATIDPVTKNGTWTFLRSDGFTNSGTFKKISCTTVVPLSTSRDGISAGSAHYNKNE